MACVIVPAAEAIISTLLTQAVKSKEAKATADAAASSHRIKLSTKLGWLNKMLWGGSALLAFEHVWHGEVTFSFPFLTGEASGILAEMSRNGVAMSAAVTAVWLVMLAACAAIEKRQASSATPAKSNA